jgi:hypothetical protein
LWFDKLTTLSVVEGLMILILSGAYIIRTLSFDSALGWFEEGR